jgi:hypothetical protein
MYNKADTAQASIPVLKDILYSLLEQTAITLVTVCNVDHELKDITNYGVGEAYQLRQRCEELINAIARLQNLGRVLELDSVNLLEPLGWQAEYDDKRQEWYLIDDGCGE